MKKRGVLTETVTTGETLESLLRNAISSKDIGSLREKVSEIMGPYGASSPVKPSSNGYRSVREDLLQAYESRTLERGRYYLRRLLKSIAEYRDNGVNDINLNRWKDYDEVLTDSLWNFPNRDTSGAHLGWYWGNFVPQIPRQLMLRYTKKGDWVLDPFAGSGTTIIESLRLGRKCIGVELNETTVKKAKAIIGRKGEGSEWHLISGDSTSINFNELLESRGVGNVSLVILHPPYHNIIKFSNDPRDLSRARSLEEFILKFSKVISNVRPVLRPGRYLAVVAGDKYSGGEWIPIGFRLMEETMRHGFRLVSIVVKNYEDTRAKRGQSELWRYRALLGGFYVFKHEYIFIFRKSGADRV
ncbi:MAG: TRM11 family SAM-dependent methyltransferase [Thermoplasmata archaeon]